MSLMLFWIIQDCSIRGAAGGQRRLGRLATDLTLAQ
ncbi:hypothetical protein KYC_10141 [Achromobacter arsenitoxydans SY8]|uniref:Uncharacterized protein n=1 Tax=Achromobacter arsenitoxydans SY8 TaxID=477184 RepID=H0F5I5_9BURK|nr:hypothetical protein KYC_10141 [Achromobacter arsenitoxydans SY8]